MWDFWGWKKTPNPEKYDNYWGTSIVLPNSDKGRRMLKGKSLHLVETTWREFLPINQNLYMPTNVYDYKGYRFMPFVKRLPLNIKKFIYQCGFSNARLDNIFRFVLSLIFEKKRNNAIKLKEEKAKVVLKYLEQNNE